MPPPLRVDLAEFARARSYRVRTDPTCVEAVIDDVGVSIRRALMPSLGGATATWIVQARAASPIRGWVRARPKHEDAPTGVRVGALPFDLLFFVEASTRTDACAVLRAEVTAALIAFGPHGELRYDDGALTFEWEDDESIDARRLDRAVALAVAVCRLPARHGLYRDGR